jgi:hypothetical protein
MDYILALLALITIAMVPVFIAWVRVILEK